MARIVGRCRKIKTPHLSHHRHLIDPIDAFALGTPRDRR
jgi:hypothetical protein